MKQKKIGTDLWVFDTSAYQITKDTDSSVIYIQGECMKEFKAVNSSTLYPKMKEYNYKTLLAQKPTWGDYIYADEEKQDVSAVWKYDSPSAPVEQPIIVKGIGAGSLTKAFGLENADTNNPPEATHYSIVDASVADLKDQSGVLQIEGKRIGETKVKATWAEDSSYNAGSSELAVKVSPLIETMDGNYAYQYAFEGDEITVSSECASEISGGMDSAAMMVTEVMDTSAANKTTINLFTLASSDNSVVSITANSQIPALRYEGLGKCAITVEWPAQTTQSGGAPTYDVSAGSMTFNVSTYIV